MAFSRFREVVRKDREGEHESLLLTFLLTTAIGVAMFAGCAILVIGGHALFYGGGSSGTRPSLVDETETTEATTTTWPSAPEIPVEFWGINHVYQFRIDSTDCIFITGDKGNVAVDCNWAKAGAE